MIPAVWTAAALTRPPCPGPGGVDLWFSDNPDMLPDRPEWLSQEEQARAARFVFPRDRRRFEQRRSLLRAVLAGALGCDPRQVPLITAPGGKPALAAAEWRFNASGSDGAVLIGLSRDLDLGVDIERRRAIPDGRELVRQFFAPSEIAALTALPDAEFERGFFACWSCKEAVVKALGHGLAFGLDRFDIAIGPDGTASIGQIDGRPTPFWLHGFDAASDCAAAVVTSIRPVAIRYFAPIHDE